MKKNNEKKTEKKMVQVGLHHCIAIILQAKALYCKAIVWQGNCIASQGILVRLGKCIAGGAWWLTDCIVI